MKLEQYKILAAARARGTFTTRDLSDQTEVNINTVKTWLTRNERFVMRTGEKRQGGRGGAPAVVWSVRAEAREEIEGLLDSSRGELRGQMMTQREAERAFDNSDARLHVKRSLLLAAWSDPDEREEHLEDARSWLAHEDERLAYWRRSGAEPKPDVLTEVEDLRDQMRAFEIGVDRLSEVVELRKTNTASQWIAKVLDLWVTQPANHGNPFHPLQLDEASSDSLGDLLHLVFRMAGRLAGISQERLLVASIASLSFNLKPMSRKIICDTILHFSDRSVGAALRQQLDVPSVSGDQQHLMMEVLVGLETWPRLINQESVGAWFDGLPSSSAWSDIYAPYYVNPARNRQGKVFSRIIEGLGASLQRVRERIAKKDSSLTNWDGEPASIERRYNDQVVRLLNSGAYCGDNPTEFVRALI